MAEKKTQLFERFLSCPVCSETFRDPVSLGCNHSFCSSCLKQFWQETTDKNCPVCKRKSSKDYLDVNFSLKELSDSFAKTLEGTSSETEDGEKVEVVYRKDQEEPQLFCKDENRAVCSACHASLHDTHTVVPLEDAVAEMKDGLKCDLKSLRNKNDKYNQMKKTYNDVMNQLTEQVLSTEGQIRAEFEKLHQFLREEEHSRLATLRKEEEQKRNSVMSELKRIEKQMSSLSETICAVEEELQKANAPFLISYRDTQSRTRAQCSLSEPQLISGALIDVNQHLKDLSFEVSRKMMNRFKFFSTGVRHGDTYQDLPLYRKRTPSSFFTSLLKSPTADVGDWRADVGDWRADVGDWPKDVGDCPEDVGDFPKCVLDFDKKSADMKGVKFTLPKQKIRHCIGVDPEEELYLYDAKDETHIDTRRRTCTDKIYPLSSVKEPGDAESTDIRMSPRKPKVSKP